MAALACTGEPISWLRLEIYSRDARDPAIAEHLASCHACRECFDEIQRDIVALPPLAIPASRARRLRWWLVPGLALAAAAVVALVVLRPAPEGEAADRVAIKGVGQVVLDVVRERAGVIRDDMRSFAAGDRWKVVVTCPPGAAAWADVAIGDGETIDHPLAPARIACGNRVVVPGAFTLTGAKPNRICVRIAPESPPPRTLDRDVACLTIVPE